MGAGETQRQPLSQGGSSEGQGERALTTAGLVGAVTTVICPVALPDQADTHPVLTLETELVADLVKLGVLGWMRNRHL